MIFFLIRAMLDWSGGWLRSSQSICSVAYSLFGCTVESKYVMPIMSGVTQYSSYGANIGAPVGEEVKHDDCRRSVRFFSQGIKLSFSTQSPSKDKVCGTVSRLGTDGKRLSQFLPRVVTSR